MIEIFAACREELSASKKGAKQMTQPELLAAPRVNDFNIKRGVSY